MLLITALPYPFCCDVVKLPLSFFCFACYSIVRKYKNSSQMYRKERLLNTSGSYRWKLALSLSLSLSLSLYIYIYIYIYIYVCVCVCVCVYISNSFMPLISYGVVQLQTYNFIFYIEIWTWGQDCALKCRDLGTQWRGVVSSKNGVFIYTVGKTLTNRKV